MRQFVEDQRANVRLNRTRGLVAPGILISLTVVITAVAGSKSQASSGTAAPEPRVEAVAGKAMPRLTASERIDAPPAAVWAFLDDCKRHSDFMANTSSREVSREGERVVCELNVSLPWPIGDLRAVSEAIHHRDEDGSYERRWRLVEGDFLYNEGSWHLTPLDEGHATLVTYSMLAEPDLMVPNALVLRRQRAMLLASLEQLRRLVLASVGPQVD